MDDKFIKTFKESLKLCADASSSCEGCIYYYGFGYPECVKQLNRTSLEVIDALQARNQRYKNKIARLKGEITNAETNNAT